MKRLIVYWLPTFLWMGLIYVLSAQPDLPTPPGPWLQKVYDKIGHGLAYAVLAWLLWRALRQRYGVTALLGAACVGLSIAYGISDEFHQAFVPGRTPSLADVAADALGATFAMVLSWKMWARRKARAQPDPR